MKSIKITEQLPDFNKPVLCLDKEQRIVILRLKEIIKITGEVSEQISYNFIDPIGMSEYYENITHWMPLPELPKE